MGDTDYIRLNDLDDLYAHESHIKIKQIGGVDYLFLVYMSNKTTHLEWQTTARAKLKVFDLSDNSLVKSYDIFYPGLTAGITMSATSEINAPRMNFNGNNLRLYVNNKSTLFKRSLDVSSSDPDDWTFTDIAVVQMTMKDALGNDVLADVTSANLQTHFEYIFGDTYAGYNDTMPHLRNYDPAVSGSNWYSTLECSGERSGNPGRIVMAISSTDAGETWTLGTPFDYTTLNRVNLIECTMSFAGIVLHVLARTTTNVINHYSSVDNGVTWVKHSDLTISTLASKPCSINAGSAIVLAVTQASEVVGNTGRTTLGILGTEDMTLFEGISKIVTPTYCHYPSLFYYGTDLFISYTKGSGTSDRNIIALKSVAYS